VKGRVEDAADTPNERSANAAAGGCEASNAISRNRRSFLRLAGEGSLPPDADQFDHSAPESGTSIDPFGSTTISNVP
jgi:hypothetical protein